MPAAGSVDEDNVEALLSGVADGVLGNGGGVLAVALLVELDVAALAGSELLEVADVDGELLDGAGTEGVAGGDEDLVLVLQEEEADLGQVGGLADAVDADDGHDVGAGLAEGGGRGGGDGVDLAEEVEGRGGGEHLGEGRLHGGLDSGVDALEVAGLDSEQFLLDALAQPDGSLARDVLLQQVLLHALHGVVEVLFGQCLSAHDVAEEAADGVDSGAKEAGLGLRLGVCALLLCLGGEDLVDFVLQVIEQELALGPRTPGVGIDLFDIGGSRLDFGIAVGVGRRVVELDIVVLVGVTIGIPLATLLDCLLALLLRGRLIAG